MLVLPVLFLDSVLGNNGGRHRPYKKMWSWGWQKGSFLQPRVFYILVVRGWASQAVWLFVDPIAQPC